MFIGFSLRPKYSLASLREISPSKHIFLAKAQREIKTPPPSGWWFSLKLEVMGQFPFQSRDYHAPAWGKLQNRER